MNISLFVTSTMFLGYLISGFFTVYHAVNEKWYITYKDFYDCKSLPLSVILIQVINVCIMIYLIVYNIFKCVCKTLTNTKSNIAFSCGSVMFFMTVIGVYIYGFYVFVNKECFAHYKEKYPNLEVHSISKGHDLEWLVASCPPLGAALEYCLHVKKL